MAHPFQKNTQCLLDRVFQLEGTYFSHLEHLVPLFQNGGSATDGVRLLDIDGTVIDTVLYDSPNTNGLLDDLRSTAGPFAPDPSEGNTLAGAVDCADNISNDGSDFVETSAISPGAENVIGGSGGSSCDNLVFTGIVINEVLQPWRFRQWSRVG